MTPRCFFQKLDSEPATLYILAGFVQHAHCWYLPATKQKEAIPLVSGQMFGLFAAVDCADWEIPDFRGLS